MLKYILFLQLSTSIYHPCYQRALFFMFWTKKNTPKANSQAKISIFFFEYSIVPVKLEIINIMDDAIRTTDNIISILCLFNAFTSISPVSISKIHKSNSQLAFSQLIEKINIFYRFHAHDQFATANLPWARPLYREVCLLIFVLNKGKPALACPSEDLVLAGVRSLPVRQAGALRSGPGFENLAEPEHIRYLSLLWFWLGQVGLHKLSGTKSR